MKNNNEKNIDIEWLLNVIFIFFCIFQPYICPISSQIIIDIILFMYITYEVFVRQNFVVKISKDIKNCMLYFVPFLAYMTGYYFFNIFFNYCDGGICGYNLMMAFIVFFRIIMIVWYLIILIEVKRWNIKKLSLAIIAVASLQLLCVLFALLIPSVRFFFNNLTLKYASSAYIITALNDDVWRSYGFASNIFDAFGYETALLIVFVFAYAKKINSKMLIFLSLAMYIMPLLNARTGVLLSIIGMIVIILTSKKKISINRIVSTLFIIIVGILIIMCVFNSLPIITQRWIMGGVESTIALVTTGEKTGAYAAILQKNIVFPSDILFGVGGDREQLGGKGIESGYINCIWRYGIIGTLLLFSGYIRLFIKAIKKSTSDFSKGIIIAYCVIFFVYLMKLFSVYNIGATLMLIGIPVIFIVKPELTRELEDKRENDKD